MPTEERARVTSTSETGRLVSVANRPPSPSARCAFCHDSLDDDATSECRGCKTILHAECRDALAECPTLGCRESVFTLLGTPHQGRAAHSRPAFRRALADLAALHRSGRHVRLPPDASLAERRECELKSQVEDRNAARWRVASDLAPSAPGETRLAGSDAPDLTRDERLRRREAEDRARARLALLEAGIDPEVWNGPEPTRHADVGRVLFQSFVWGLVRLALFPYTALILAGLMATVFTAGSWLEVLSRRRLRFPRLASFARLVSGWFLVEWALTPFLYVAALSVTLVVGGGASKVVAAVLLVTILPVLRLWYDALFPVSQGERSQREQTPGGSTCGR